MKYEYENYNHHGKDVWVRKSLKGEHRKHCLCYSCNKFNSDGDNCKRAQELYEFCVKYDMVIPVYECPEFEDVDLIDYVTALNDCIRSW